ncbi:MAG: protoporphyrin/coproporphyrin ferrochelatase [Actinomycetota bacterium]|nr:protoporphyrin/coproporphyrin ferrochelatase [Actinomycetota bacterium]
MKHALLLVSFGGPEGPDDVVPFLTNVTRGRGIPPERLEEVGSHYLELFGGVSPINAQCRELVAALQAAQDRLVYWGNRNWHPLLTDTLAQMRADGVDDAYAIVTSAFPSYSGCRQYQEDIAGAQVDGLPRITKLRHYYCEDGFLSAQARNVAAELGSLREPRLVFTAHSIPLVMAETSGPSGGAYVEALRTAAAGVVDRLGSPYEWDLVFQSRSGPPQVPWLEPDIGDHLEQLHSEDVRDVVLIPIGFTSDHVEVVYDLDVQAASRAASLDGMTVRRAKTVGTDPEFVQMLVRLVAERAAGPEVDSHGCVATHDRCPARCCPPPIRPTTPR